MLAEARAGAAPVRERGILFTGEMVRAILAGTKTQTRRVAQLNGSLLAPDAPDSEARRALVEAAKRAALSVCPYGAPGDRLWVREGFAPVDGNGHKCAPADAAFVVLSDGAQKYRDGSYSPALPKYQQGAFDGIKWRPSIYMPRWASRITLALTEVRVERVQDIREEDARAEGVEDRGELDLSTPRSAFAALWDRINGPRGYGWEANPWVWCLTFKRLEAADGK